jgi:hypothetical protein
MQLGRWAAGTCLGGEVSGHARVCGGRGYRLVLCVLRMVVVQLLL